MKKIYTFIENLIPDFLKSIFVDTLKINEKWSRTSLTMFTAWVSALYMAFFDLTKNGFHMEVFLTLVGVALGSKVTDSISKKISPPEKDTLASTDDGSANADKP